MASLPATPCRGSVTCADEVVLVERSVVESRFPSETFLSDACIGLCRESPPYRFMIAVGQTS